MGKFTDRIKSVKDSVSSIFGGQELKNEPDMATKAQLEQNKTIQAVPGQIVTSSVDVQVRPGDRIAFKDLSENKIRMGTVKSVDRDTLVVKTDDNKVLATSKSQLVPNEQLKFLEQQKRLNNIAQKENKKSKEAKVRSFAVITKDYVNDTSGTPQAKEQIISGKTKDGVHYEATIYGKNISRESIERIATATALSRDMTTAREDSAFTNDRVQELLNNLDDSYIVYKNGSYVTLTELMDNPTIEEAENLENYGDAFIEEDDFEEPEKASISGPRPMSLEELAEQANDADIPSFYNSAVPEEAELDASDFDPEMPDITERSLV